MCLVFPGFALVTEWSRYITAPVESTYPAYAKQKGFEPQSETFRSGMKAYWIGDPKSEDVIIWYHGKVSFVSLL